MAQLNRDVCNDPNELGRHKNWQRPKWAGTAQELGKGPNGSGYYEKVFEGENAIE